MSATATRQRFLRTMLAATAIGIGGLLVLAAVTIGHCSAFGGRCPSESPPLVEDDVFGMATTGSFMAVAVPIWLVRPSRSRLVGAVAIGVVVALAVGFATRAVASG